MWRTWLTLQQYILERKRLQHLGNSEGRWHLLDITYACFLVWIKLVSMVTGTTRPTKCMFTVMGTTTIVLFTAIDNFQFNPFPNKQKMFISTTIEKPEYVSTKNKSGGPQTLLEIYQHSTHIYIKGWGLVSITNVFTIQYQNINKTINNVKLLKWCRKVHQWLLNTYLKGHLPREFSVFSGYKIYIYI